MKTYKISVVSILLFTLSPAYAGNVTLPNNFTANTPAKAAEVNANFSAIKAAVDDNDSRINTLTEQSKIPAYKYKNIIGTLSNSTGSSPLSIVYFDLDITTPVSTIGGGGSGTARPTLGIKLIAIDSPMFANLLSSSIQQIPISHLTLTTSDLVIDLYDVLITELNPQGKEFSLPSRFLTASTDPDLVSMTIGKLSRVSMSDSSGTLVDFNLATYLPLSNCNISNGVSYIQQNNTAPNPLNMWPIYHYEFGVLSVLDAAGNPGPATTNPATVFSSLVNDNRDVCLFGAILTQARMNQIRIDVPGTDSVGRSIIQKNLALADSVLSSYHMYSGETGAPVLAVSYVYSKVTINYASLNGDPATSFCWDVARRQPC